MAPNGLVIKLRLMPQTGPSAATFCCHFAIVIAVIVVLTTIKATETTRIKKEVIPEVAVPVLPLSRIL